jgi:hypothetical protein
VAAVGWEGASQAGRWQDAPNRRADMGAGPDKCTGKAGAGPTGPTEPWTGASAASPQPAGSPQSVRTRVAMLRFGSAMRDSMSMLQLVTAMG